MRLLAIRPHSREELGRKLRRRGCADEAVEAVLDRCVEVGYLDDGAYARALVDRRSSSRGSAAIASELAAKGIGRDAVEQALAGREEAEIEAAARLLARLRPSGADRSRAAAKLQRRGFSPQVIGQAWRRLGGESAGDSG